MIRVIKKFISKCYIVDESSLGIKVYILYLKYYIKSGESRNQGQDIGQIILIIFICIFEFEIGYQVN